MSTNVQTTITVAGNDQFSAMFGKLKQGADDVAKQAGKAADRTGAIGERAGNLERGFMGLKDIIGGIGEGPLAQIADKMGGIEAVTQGFGAKMGLVGLAIGAVAMGATMLYERMEKARKAALDVELLRLAAIKEDGEALARHLNVSQELLGVKQGIRSVEEVTGAAMGHAKSILENQRDIIEAQKNKEEDKIALLKVEGANLRGLLGIDELRLQRAKDQAEIVGVNAAEQIRRARAREESEEKVNTIMDDDERLRVRNWNRGQERRNLDLQAARLAAEIKKATGVQEVALEKEFTDISRRRRDLDAQERQDASAGEAIANTRRSERQAAWQRAHAAQSAAEQKRQAAEKEHEAWARQNFAERRDELIARDQDLEATQDRIRNAEAARASSPLDRAKLELKHEQIRAETELARIGVKYAEDSELLAAKSIEVANKVIAADNAVAEVERKNSDEAIAKAKEERAANIDKAMGVASAAVAGLEQIGLAEQAAAGLKAVISAAEGGLALARGNYAGAVAGAFAAVQFGRVALGGGSGGGQASSGGQGGGMGTATASQTGSASGGQSGAVIINFNKGFYGDAASTAKGIAGTMKSLKGTGVAASKGA